MACSNLQISIGEYYTRFFKERAGNGKIKTPNVLQGL
jgi:hypothetical protein